MILKSKKNKGFTLVELIVAIAVLALLITAVVTFMGHESVTLRKQEADISVQNSGQETLNELSPREFEITITGGEPTLKIERFVKTLKMCHKKGFHFRTISTNGLNLLKKYKGKEVCEYMANKWHEESFEKIVLGGIGADGMKERIHTYALTNYNNFDIKRG